MDGDVPMRHGWQSIGLGAVGVEASVRPQMRSEFPIAHEHKNAMAFRLKDCSGEKFVVQFQ
jgi:hypothetical protein